MFSSESTMRVTYRCDCLRQAVLIGAFRIADRLRGRLPYIRGGVYHRPLLRDAFNDASIRAITK